MRVTEKWMQIVALAAFCTTASEALASDGVIEINQVKALAGGVTPGDTADFPVTISQSGSYRLTSNLDVGHLVDGSGILITADDVTIDLNGFWIQGSARCITGCDGQGNCTMDCGQAGTGIGIDGTPGTHYLGTTVRNGGIRGMRGVGMELAGEHFVEQVKVIWNGGGGMALSRDGVVKDSTAAYNGGEGIASAGLIERCTAQGNKTTGLRGVTVQNSLSRDNLGAGIGVSALALANVSLDNALHGLTTSNATGYGQNSLLNNNGGGAQVSGGGKQLGTNMCGAAFCP